MTDWISRIGLACLLAVFPPEAFSAEVVVLLDPDVRPYVEVFAAFQLQSEGSPRILERKEDGDLRDERELVQTILRRRPHHVLAIGGEVLSALAPDLGDIPILYTMVLNPAEKLAGNNGNVTGVSVNVAPEHIMKVLHRIAPGFTKIGVVYNPAESSDLVERGRRALTGMGKTLIAESASTTSEALRKTKELLPRVDGFWMIPGRTVQSLDMVRYLLFAAEKEKKALIGISGKYVKAGALFGFNVDLERLGYQTAGLSNMLFRGKPVRSLPPEDANEVRLVVNGTTARNLGITLSKEILQEADHVY